MLVRPVVDTNDKDQLDILAFLDNEPFVTGTLATTLANGVASSPSQSANPHLAMLL